ncbi:MAG: sodium:solute symporter [Chitinophagales bacterium]|nr:sodium:solute symporter [Chitinophagales bacterium]
MSPILILFCILGYFSLLLIISKITSKDADNDSYFIGNRKSPWFLVAFGLIADSLSGVTYISVPGAVGKSQFSYMQLVLGYLFGYLVISYVLLPIYYRMQLTSIYVYLRERFGVTSQKTGSFFFLLSRLFGSAARLYLASIVMQTFLFTPLGIPFELSVTILIALILTYTYKGGIKTLVYTDTLQSLLLLMGLLLTIIFIMRDLNFGVIDTVQAVYQSEYSKMFFWDFRETNFFIKQFLGGMFIAIAMTGLDQNMMQKNLSCPSLKAAQRNINSFSLVVVLVNLLFLSLGALLYIYSERNQLPIPQVSDELYPLLAFEHLGFWAGLVFIIGLSAATFSSSDSVLTALTTSFYIDFLKKDEHQEDESQLKKKRYIIHFCFAILLLAVILGIKVLNDKNIAIIDLVFLLAGYTYGPLLGLFFLGIFTKVQLREKWVPLVAVLSPLVGHSLKTILNFPALEVMHLEGNLGAYYQLMFQIGQWLNQSLNISLNYRIGNELILINGIIMVIGLLCISKKN